MKLPVITNSQIACWRRCPHEHHVSYVLGFRVATQEETLRFGSLFHVGLEAWWKAAADEQRLTAALEAIAGKAHDDFELARAEVLLRGYDARWTDDMQHYEVLGVEVEFRAPLVNPATGAASRTYELGGKLDVIVRDRRDGLVKMIEHKTSADDITAGSDYWKMLMLDPQVSTYFAGGKAAGFDIAECIYDVIGKPGLRQASVPLTDDDGVKIVHDASGERVRTKDGKKWRQTGDTELGYVLQTRPETVEEFRARLLEHVAENPERYYVRGKVVRLESEVANAAYDSWQTARAIREAELAGRAPRNPGACRRYGRMCGFFDACVGVASLEDETRFRRVDNVHEELSLEAA